MFDFSQRKVFQKTNTSTKKNLKTPQKNINKSRSKTGLYTQSHAKLKYSKHINDDHISQKYLYVQLTQSAQKNNTMEKIMKDKDERIKELQLQIKENQLLVKETIEKWKKSKHQEKQQLRKLSKQLQNMNSKVVKLDNVNSELGTKVSEKDNEIQKLKEEKEELEKENKGYEQRYKKLKHKYEVEREQWKGMVPMILDLLEFVKKVPPQLLQSQQEDNYFKQFNQE